MSNVLSIAGMHRSGTSLAAMWLYECGLYLGDDLMKGQFDNPKGHFEDLEVLKIHQQDLKFKGLKTDGLRLNNRENFTFEDISKKGIQNLINHRNLMDLWGWKEPRGTLYLLEWKKLIPALKVFAIYRPFHEVVNSLERRTKHSFFKTNKYSLIRRVLHLAVFPLYIVWERRKYREAWLQYNKKIISFKRTYPKDCILISLDQLLNYCHPTKIKIR
jgi:hypothetical protein